VLSTTAAGVDDSIVAVETRLLSRFWRKYCQILDGLSSGDPAWRHSSRRHGRKLRRELVVPGIGRNAIK
jgi:hypothetical protein